MITFSVSDPVFETNPLFVFGCSAQTMSEYLRRRFGVRQEIESSAAGMMLTFDCSPWRVVWLKKVPHDPAGEGCLAHEILHLVTRICGDKGIPIHHHISTGECGDETAAYLLGFFLMACLRKLRRAGKRR